MAVATISIAFALLFLVCASDAKGSGGFTIDLIHRDSPRSPFYNSSETPSQRLNNAFRRSFHRLSHFNPSSEAAQLDPPESTILIKSSGDYLMDLFIGTPPFRVKAIADTGSDLIWTQCKPCIDCYNQTDPIFDPSNSSTYRTIACPSNQCNTLQGSCSSDSVCQYNESYQDKSHTIGDYAFDTVTLASTTGTSVPFPNTLIGCGHDNNGTFKQGGGSGIVGLGGGDESLISQLGTSIDGKFSYCLLPYTSQDDQTSKLSFGDNAVVSGSGVVSTPLVQDPSPITSHFFLKLEAISVDDTKIPFSSSSSASGGGNIVIDSGTMLTLLEQSFYSKLEDAVDKVVGRERVIDPQGNLPPLCYKVSASEDFKTPNIIVHFSGADVKLEPNNAFLRWNEETVCFAFKGGSDSIYGNVAQSNFLVGYDLKGKTVSFKPTDCTNF